MPSDSLARELRYASTASRPFVALICGRPSFSIDFCKSERFTGLSSTKSTGPRARVSREGVKRVGVMIPGFLFKARVSPGFFAIRGTDVTSLGDREIGALLMHEINALRSLRGPSGCATIVACVSHPEPAEVNALDELAELHSTMHGLDWKLC